MQSTMLQSGELMTLATPVECRAIDCTSTASTSCRIDNSCRADIDFLPTFL